MTECTQSFLFYGGGDDRFLDMYDCCSIAHAKRTLHIRYPNNISSAMVFGIPKINKQIIVYINT